MANNWCFVKYLLNCAGLSILKELLLIATKPFLAGRTYSFIIITLSSNLKTSKYLENNKVFQHAISFVNTTNIIDVIKFAESMSSVKKVSELEKVNLYTSCDFVCAWYGVYVYLKTTKYEWRNSENEMKNFSNFIIFGEVHKIS